MGTISLAVEGYDASLKAKTNTSLDVRQYMGVKKGSDELHVTPLDAGDTSATVIVGVAQADANDEESVAVRVGGVSLVRASGAITQNDLCECIYSSTEDENGSMKKLTKLALGVTNMIACRALEDAADKEFFKAQLICEKRIPTT